MAAQFSQTIRILASDSPRPAYWVWVIAGSFLMGWALWFCGTSVNVYQLSQRARLEVRQAPHQLDAMLAGQIASTALKIGDDVSEGQVLVELDSSRDRLKLAEEEARLAGTVARIESMQREIAAREQAKGEDVEMARAAIDVAKARSQESQVTIDFSKGAEQRQGQLLSAGVGAKVEALKAAAETQKAIASQRGWEAEAQRIEREAKSKEFQNNAQIAALQNALASIQGDVAISRATIQRLRSELEKFQMRAPVSGRLADVGPHRIGSYVAEGQRLATILPRGDLIIVAEFMPSVAFGRILPGQRAHLRLDGYSWVQYGAIEAIVTNVAGEIRDGLVRVELSVEGLPNDAIRLQHGLPGTIEVITEKATPAQLLMRTTGLLISGGDRGGRTP